MFKLFLILSTLVALVIAGYQFQDSDFNDDLTADINEDIDSARFKRSHKQKTKQVECKPKSKSTEEKIAHCCNEDNGEMPNEQEPDAIKKAKESCIQEFRAKEKSADPLSCENVSAMRKATVCTAECMSKKFGLLEENGQFNRKALQNYTQTMVGSTKWKADVLEQYVDGCLEELSTAKDMNKTEESKNADCNSNALDFHYCTWRKFVQGCPANLRIQSKKCKKLRSRLANDDSYYLHKFHKIIL